MKEKTIEENFYIDGSLALQNEISYNEKVKKVGIYNKYIKRGIDIFLSFIGLIILSPIFCIIAISIKLNSEGPTIYKHERIGKDGKKIEMYKFRTMVMDAYNLEKYFSQEQMKEFKENYKVKNDPRITKIGKFLRKTSLDELPQIYNILKGELSIIGPRPIIDEELEKYGTNKAKFLSVTPGLTGYWACNGRSDTTYEERIAMELYYIDNMSIKMDTKIFFKTIMSVLNRKGAI